MEKNITLIGGDLRMVKLAELLAKDNFTVYTYALEEADSLYEFENVKYMENMYDAIAASHIVVGPVPLSIDRENVIATFSKNVISIEEFSQALLGKKFLAGNIPDSMKDILNNNSVEYIDLLKREDLVVLNTIATAEGTIKIAIEETPRTLHGSNVLVMGFGRTGKVLAKMLDGIGAKVHCEARKNEDISWIKAYGYTPVHLNDLNSELGKFDVIINTIPFTILDSERLDLVKEDAVIIDISSNPGGVDRKAAREKNKKVIWALSISGKVAPLTSAEFIKETLYNISKEANQ